MADPVYKIGASQAEGYPKASFSLRNRLARAMWGIGCLLLFRFTPRTFHSWRRMVLILFGAKIGERCRIYRKVQIWAPWNLICADESIVGDGATLYNQAVIRLGRRSVVSQGAHLCTGSHDYESWQFELFAKPITVGDHAWIAAECFVHPGVTIGEGAVIGARSVVTRDTPAWMVCAGNPCTPIKPRTMRDAGKSEL
jgi:putative colanic acid biosynthesis acetyltransferase WcaF